MSLKEYHKKRDFKKTKEPVGQVKNKKTKSLNFVVQYHEARAKHYDFRLEWNGMLLSWAVPKGPPLTPNVKRLAVKVEDHPLEYQYFEGVIPKGEYGGGTVEIWDKGNYAPLENMEDGLKHGNIKVVLNGNKLKGDFHIVKTKENNWILFKGKEEFKVENTSVKTNNKIIKNPFSQAPVQLTKLETKIPKGNNWLFEVKYDGYRIISYVENNKVSLYSRNGADYTQKFPNIVNSLIIIGKNKSFVLDGEMVVTNEDGKTDFGDLQESIRAKRNNFNYVVFDILAHNGKDLRGEKLLTRKTKLEKLLNNCPENITFSNYVIGKGEESFNAAKELGLEGIVGKKTNSIYSGNRDGDWIKIKCYNEQEFVVVGYCTTPKNKTLSALLLGYYNKNELKYVGKVGTGFNTEIKTKLANSLQKLVIKKSKFDVVPKINDEVFWVRPTLVVQVQFAEITKENLLRQASFKGLRLDKDAKDVTLEGQHERNH